MTSLLLSCCCLIFVILLSSANSRVTNNGNGRPAQSTVVLTSPIVTDLGVWGDWDRCPSGTFVKGMRLKLEPYQGPLDDTGLNGIQFHCGRSGESSRVVQSRRISSLVGSWGSWGHVYDCGSGYAVGFQLRSESLRSKNDDTGASNLRLFCSGRKGYLEGSGLQWGEWTQLQLCPLGKAICGLRTQVHPSQGLGQNADDTALNNLSVECCSVRPDSE